MAQQRGLVINRRTLGQWCSIIGGVGTLVGFLSLILQAGFTPFVIVTLGIGLLMLAAWAWLTPDEFRAFVRGRQIRHSTSAVFGMLLLIGIAALAFSILQKASVTLDMTEGHRFSLSNETKTVLNRLNRPIRFTGFYSSSALAQRELDNQVIELYEAGANGVISHEYLDPTAAPAAAAAFDLQNDAQLFISYLKSDGTADLTTVARVPRGDSLERDLTSAIARLLVAGTLKVYFVSGHGELDTVETGQSGLSGIANGIRESGLLTEPLDLPAFAQTATPIPADASALIFARPLVDLTPAEIALVDAYLKRGGGVFIMADALFTPDAFLHDGGTFSTWLWDHYGIRALNGVVVDAASSGASQLDLISAAIYTDTPITTRLNDTQYGATQFRVALALTVDDTPPADTPNGKLIMSSTESYAETDLKSLLETQRYTFDAAADLPGPHATAVWASNTKTGGKIILVGDADFATNGLILTGGNSILFTDGLSWLSGFGDRINYAARAYTVGLPVIFVSASQLDLIGLFVVILLPALVLLVGLAVWWRRSRA